MRSRPSTLAHAKFAGSGLPHSLSSSPPIHTALHSKNHWRSASYEGTRRASAVDPPPQKTSSPELLLWNRVRLTQDRRLESPAAGTTHRHVHTARQPFRRDIVAGTTQTTPTSPDCLAENIASLRCELPLAAQRTSTWATLPDSSV